MKKKAPQRKRKSDIALPPITVGFEEAVSRLLRVKPGPHRKRNTDTPKKAR